MQSSLWNTAKLAVGVFIVAVFVTGCENPTQKKRISEFYSIDIVDAESLLISSGAAQTGSQFAARSEDDGLTTVLYKIEADGNVVEVVHRNEDGESIVAPLPLEVKNINNDWVAVLYTTKGPVFEHTRADLVVVSDKSNGRVYKLPDKWLAVPAGWGYGKVVAGELYLLLDSGESIEVFRITPSDNPTATRVSTPVDTVPNSFPMTPNTFNVSDDGLVLYNFQTTDAAWYATRAISPTGSVGTIRPAVGVEGEGTSVRSNFWRGPNGDLYFSDEFGDPIVVYKAEFSGSTWAPVPYAEIAEFAFPPSLMYSHYLETGERVVGFTGGYVVELYGPDVVPAQVLRGLTLEAFGYINGDTLVGDTALVGDSAVLLIDGALVPFDPTAFAIGEAVVLADTSFEIVEIAESDDTHVQFRGRLAADGSYASGLIDITDGSVMVDDAAGGSMIQQEEQIH